MLTQYNNIFIVGIKGVAMANIARILVQMGKNVSGSDVHEEFITDHELAEIPILKTFDAKKLPSDIDLVIYSAAHQGIHNPQVQEAYKRDITVMHQAVLIEQLLSLYTSSVAVAGCHGKTTTASLLAYALKKLNVHPGFLVGVSEFNGIVGGELGKPNYFVLEADEYAIDPPRDKTPKFYFFHPTHALVTNIDFDHPDVFTDIEHTKQAFVTFLKQVKTPTGPQPATTVLCTENPHIPDITRELVRDSYITYGFSKEDDMIISQIKKTEGGMQFQIECKILEINDMFEISLFGEKNVLNAAGAIAILRLLGFSLNQIQIAIEDFTGAKRRFELVHKENDTYIFDDYAHHPQEIEATIQAARVRFPDKRIILIFQPHTFSRTVSLQKEFVHALSLADVALIAPIFGSAREQMTGVTITSKDLETYAKKANIHTVLGYNAMSELIESLPQHIKRGDILFTMGAGDIYKSASSLKEIIKKL